ncbi:hypothetical protein [Lacinutrix chionoecetis]
MTRQATNRIIYKEEEYSLECLFDFNHDIETYGLKYYRNSTAGGEFYQCFEIIKNELRLNNVKAVDLDFKEQHKKQYIPKPINGVLPHTLNSLNDLCYENINLKIPYSGDVLIMNDFIAETCSIIDILRPWHYKKVLKLSFKKGIVINERMLSRQQIANLKTESGIAMKKLIDDIKRGAFRY